MSHPTAQARHRVIHLSTAGRLPRLLAAMVSAALLAAGLVVGFGAISATALSDIQLSATSDTSILAGEGAKVTFTATNPATDASGNLYNLSYQYVLPTGVSYQGGSTSPDTVGEPSVVTIVDTPANPPTVPTAITHQVLNWTNASDLAFGETATFTFNVQVDATVYPVGAAVQATDASAYANASPRILPKFDATTGAPIGGSYTAFGDVTPPPSTQVAAIKLTKTEGSPETELMRGVHDQTTVYKLAVTETGEGATDGVTVVDDIPAQLEYLGCGQVDNSVLRTAEYPGAPSLTQTPAIPGADCIQPQSVVTKLVSGKVVTEVTWSLGILAANQVVNIWYAAGIPLKENTTTWDGPGGTPALTGAQTANLDNNNGPSTRQSGKAATMTNTAVASGAYQGQLASSAPSSTVTSTATYTNKISDLSVVKTTSNSGFDAGAVANYSLNIRASEYESDSQMTIVDTIPNGLCPLVPDLSAVLTVDSGAQNPPAECQATGSISNATVTGVEAKADGSFLLTMVPDPTTTIAANGNLVIGYSALMRAMYTNVGAAPTAAGDSFTNSVDVNGTSTSVQDATTLAVEDGSKATLGSTPPTIQKLILPRPTTGTAVDCAAHDADYIDNHDYPKTGTTLPVYNLGDKICFKLIVDFSTSTRTRNAQIQDFVPTGTTYNGYSVSSSSTLGASEVVPETGGDPDSPVFDLGATVAGDTSGDLFVEKGVVLTMYVSAIVTSTAPDTSVDITANLMKYRQEATAGTVTALRYQANYGVAPAETVSLTKQTIARTPNTTISDPKDTLVQEGDSVTFGLTITNTGTSAIGNDFDVDNPTVWDALPAGITCADFVSASDGGVCTDPGDAGHPVLADTTVSTIVWSAVPTTIAAGSTYQLTYVLHIATGTSISQHFTNTASVVAFQAPNTNGGQTDFYPLGSLNPAHDSDGNTTQANDTSKFHTADAVVSKTATPNLPGTNKSASQVVAGETVDYTYSVVIPANSTVFNATLSDTLPTGLTLTANSTDQATINGTAYPVGATLPSGFTLTSSGTLTFPTTWDNTSSSPVTVSVILHGVLVGVGLSSGSLQNTAAFASTSAVSPSSAAVTTAPATAAVSVTVPVPTLTKTVSPTTPVASGDTVTYTITAGNTAGAPAAYDPVITDCLPSGLIFGSFASQPTATVTSEVPGDGTSATNNCAIGSTFLTWTLPSSTSLLSPSTTVVTFTATVGTTAVGRQTYPNTARMVSSTLANSVNDPSTELVLNTTSSTASVVITGATVSKSVTNPTTPHVVGSNINYSVSVVLPANVNFFNAAIIDTLPTPTGSVVPTGTATVTCLTASNADCSGDLPDGPNYTLASSGSPATKIGWLLGTIGMQSYTRTVTVAYSVTIADIGTNTRGKTLVNSATLGWNDSSTPVPTDAGASFTHTAATPASTTVTVASPLVTQVKKVNGGTTLSAVPGSTFTYTIVTSNDNNTNGADAYDVNLVDTIPTGIVVDRSTISAGGVASPATGVVTSITWPLGTIAKGTSAPTASFNASLADSTTLTGSALVNSAQVTAYRTLEGAGHLYPANTASTASVTPAFPNVALTKLFTATGTNSSVAYMGTTIGYTLTFKNNGAGVASTVTPTDVLPANWVLVGTPSLKIGSGSATSYAPTSSTIASNVQTLIWPAISNLAAGATATVTYTAEPTSSVTTSPGVGSAIPHTNTLTAVTTDPTGADHHTNSVPANVPFTSTASAVASAHVDKADIAITKVAGHALVAGTTTTDAWILNVTNVGGSTGSDAAVGPFTVTDTPTLPAGVTVTSASGPGWTCSTPDSTGAFSCTRSDGIAAAAANATTTFATAAPISVSVNVNSTVAANAELDNTASVTDLTYDPNTANNTASRAIFVTTSADLSVTKTANSPFTAGTTATWTLSATNNGPSIARWPITIIDTLPTSGITTASATASGTDWTCGPVTAGTITCTYNGPSGTSALGLAVATTTPSITVSAPIPSSFTGSLTNVADATSGTSDPTTSNNHASVQTTVGTQTTLTVNKSLLTSPFVAGANATYEIVVTNTGTPDARSVVINDPLPNGLVYSSFANVSGGGTWSCSDTGTPSASNAKCTLTGTIGGSGTASNTATVRITVTTPSALTSNVINRATASAANAPDAHGDSPSNITTMTEADLSVTKSHPTDPVHAGTNVTYTIEVKNLAGLSDEPAGATVIDTLPNGMSFVSVTPVSGWSCAAPVLQQVTCTSTAPIVSGATAPHIAVVASVPASAGAGTYTNQADVASAPGMTDPVASNNHFDDPTTVDALAALSVTKTVLGGATTWVAGTNITYTITVTNAGPSDARTVNVLDTLPSNFSMVSISSTDNAWSCSVSTFVCTRSVMAPGSSAITVVAHIASSVADATTAINTAGLQWSDSRATPNTASATATVTVLAHADLRLVKTPSLQSATAGTNVSFALDVTNLGDSDAVAPVVITDTLPVGLRYVSSGGGWECSAATVAVTSTQAVTCTFGTVAAPLSLGAGIAASTLTMITSTDPALGSVTLDNTATVASATTDPNSANNTSTASVNFFQSVDLSITKTHTGHGVIGTTTDFTITVSNAGPSVAQDVTVVDTVPNGLAYAGFAGSAAAWTACVAGTTSILTGATPVTCTLDPTVTIAPAASAPALHIQATVGAAAYPAVVNTASVSSSTTELHPADNSTTDTLTVDPLVNLFVTKTHVGQLAVNKNADYLLSVTNTGDTEDPGGFTTTDVLPAGLTYVSSSGTNVACVDSSGTVTCTFAGALAVNATRTVTLTVAVGPAAHPTVVNSATVASLWPQLTTHALVSSDTAQVDPPALSFTGSNVNLLLWALMILASLIAGAVLLLLEARRRRRRTTGEVDVA